MYAVCPEQSGRAEYHKRKMMKTFEIKGKLREATGKKDSKKLRNENKVPCVLYGSEKNIHFYVKRNELIKVIYTPSVYLINLDIDGDKHQAIIQDWQFHPVRDEVIHIDFLKVTDDKPVKVAVPVEVKGFAKGIQKGGKLQVEMRRLKVLALAKDLPDVISIDVSDLDIGDTLRVSDLEIENVTFLNNKAVPVIRIVVTRTSRLEPLPEDEEAAAEAEGEDESGEEGKEESSEQ